jgi:hypothetical protein
MAGWESHWTTWTTAGLRLAPYINDGRTTGVVIALLNATREREDAAGYGWVFGWGTRWSAPLYVLSKTDAQTAAGSFVRFDESIDRIIPYFRNTNFSPPTMWTEAALMAHLGETRLRIRDAQPGYVPAGKFKNLLEGLTADWVSQQYRILNRLTTTYAGGADVRHDVPGGFTFYAS